MNPHRLPLLPGLDGLRAFSVAAVLIYHAEGSWLPGGFLGVEFFFVISGFLITAQLLLEWRTSGGIKLGRFWMRRARRLLPAVFGLLLVVVTGSLLFFPDEVTEVRDTMLASLGYVTNWYLIFDHQPYFQSFGRPPLLQHLWSLAVEEQFYLLWPVLLSVALKWMRPALVLPCVLALALWSSLLMIGLYHRGVDPDRLYYGTDTRAAGLLIGAALAFVWTPWQHAALPGVWTAIRVRALDVVGVAAAALLVLLALKLNESHSMLYTGGFAITSLTSAVLIAVVVHPASLVGKLLGVSPLRWVGVRAYSLYLWHWPVFMLTRPHVDVPLDGIVLAVLQIAGTAVLAEISFRFVESPIRNGALGRLRGRLGQLPRQPAWQQGIAVTGSAAAVAGLVALSATVASARAPEAPSYLSVPRIQGVITADAAATPPPPPALAADLDGGVPGVDAASPQPTQAATAPPGNTRGVATPTVPASPVSSSAEPRKTATASETPAASDDPNGSPFQSSVSSSSSSSSSVPPAPTAPPPAAGGVRATAVGDSVMLGAAYEMANVLGSVDVDAEVGRQMNVLLQILQYRKEQGLLADIVIVQVGNNGPVSEGQFDEMMQLLSDVKQVIVLNVHVPLPWEAPNNSVIAAGVQRYANATLVDWHAASADRPELFWSDNVHLRPEGASVYVGLIASSIR